MPIEDLRPLQHAIVHAYELKTLQQRVAALSEPRDVSHHCLPA